MLRARMALEVKVTVAASQASSSLGHHREASGS
jgi:hypothetical protein